MMFHLAPNELPAAKRRANYSFKRTQELHQADIASGDKGTNATSNSSSERAGHAALFDFLRTGWLANRWAHGRECSLFRGENMFTFTVPQSAKYGVTREPLQGTLSDRTAARHCWQAGCRLRSNGSAAFD
jgi:hypothetical protein